MSDVLQVEVLHALQKGVKVNIDFILCQGISLLLAFTDKVEEVLFPRLPNTEQELAFLKGVGEPNNVGVASMFLKLFDQADFLEGICSCVYICCVARVDTFMDSVMTRRPPQSAVQAQTNRITQSLKKDLRGCPEQSRTF